MRSTGMSEHRHCDQCGKSAPSGWSLAWYHLARPDRPGPPHDFCSAECVCAFFSPPKRVKKVKVTS